MKKYVSVPVVMVKVKGSIEEILKEGKEADIIQIHRVLNCDEIQQLLSYDRDVILYVPSSREYEDYFRKIVSKTNYMILLDKDKENRVDLGVAEKWIKEYSKVGIGGGITPQNVRKYISLNPYWIDISSGIESYKGKKDPNKMFAIINEVRKWRSIQ